MAHLSNGMGSAVIKKKFRGVPLIRRALGTRDPETVKAVGIMYDALYATGRLDVLEGIARGRLHPLVVFSRWSQRKELPSADVFPPLADTWAQWAGSVAVSDDYRRDLRYTGRALQIPADATLAELPQLFADLKRGNLSKSVKVNRARSHVQAFLRDTVGVSHPLYAAVKDIRPLPRKARSRGQPHSVQSIRELCEKLGPIAGPMAWTMAATGMGPKEYWRDGFEVLADRVLIHGQKREGRDRMVPHWTTVVAPSLSLRTFRELLRAASGGTVGVYDLRRSFARWTEEAGTIETNRAAYLGHGPKSVSMLYSWGALPGQLAADAARLARYAGEESPRFESAADTPS